LAAVRTQILPLAEQHASPEKIGQFYTALVSGYTVYGGLGLPPSAAQTYALQLVQARAEVAQLYDLYKVMYGYHGLGFSQAVAQQTALQQALVGASADQFKSTYLSTKSLEQAVQASVNSNCDGVTRRHARNGEPYTSLEFQKQLWGCLA